jgi:hypothetical protein
MGENLKGDLISIKCCPLGVKYGVGGCFWRSFTFVLIRGKNLMRTMRVNLFLSLIVSLLIQTVFLSAADSQAEYQKLQSHLERENNPAQKGRLMLKLADWHLTQAIQESRQSDLQKVDEMLVRFTDWVKDAQDHFRQEFVASPKKGQNTFRQAEMLLNMQIRKLENLKTNYSFDQQQIISRAITVAQKTREDLLSYLFGEENVRGVVDSPKSQN